MESKLQGNCDSVLPTALDFQAIRPCVGRKFRSDAMKHALRPEPDRTLCAQSADFLGTSSGSPGIERPAISTGT